LSHVQKFFSNITALRTSTPATTAPAPNENLPMRSDGIAISPSLSVKSALILDYTIEWIKYDHVTWLYR
jgi:hypothetical protein